MALDSACNYAIRHFSSRLPYHDAQLGPLQPVSGRIMTFWPKERTHTVKPLFMMWGFDSMSGAYDVNGVYNTLNGDDHDKPGRRAANDRMLDRLLAAGYDCIVVLPDDTQAHLQSNALLFVTAMELVYEAVPISVANSVIGFSAGGIIARWALNWRQKYVNDTVAPWSTNNYFSYDTPHRGANVPLSLQHFVSLTDKITKYIKGYEDAFKDVVQQINCHAARQLAVWHLGVDGEPGHRVPRVDPFRQRLLDELGDTWPVHLRRYAISNGSGLGTAQPCAPGTTVLRMWAGIDFRAMPKNSEAGDVLRYENLLGSFFPGLHVSDGFQPLDSAPGSTSPFYQSAYDKAWPLFDEAPAATCFVPTTSSLDISDDVWNDWPSDQWRARSLFDGYRVPHGDTNEPHVHVNGDITDFILMQLGKPV